METVRRRQLTLTILLVTFGAGAVLMALEILAMRLVAKTFGSALREVSAVIAVFLAAMSAGYALGGRWGDRRPEPSTLAAVLVVGGLLTLVIPFIEGPVANAVFESTLPLGAHAAVVSIVLFAAPACFMASVTPIAVRLRVRSLDQSGSVAGEMSAVSTVGSIAGTLSAGFVLISYLPLSRGILLLGLLSCGFGLVALRAPRALGVMTLFALVWPAPVAATVLLERDTAYHHIIVEETTERRLLRFNSTLQGSISLKDPMKGAIPYIYYLHNAFVIAPDVRSVLILGLGSASAPRHILHYHPQVQEIVVAEIDPVVLEIAKQHFAMPDDPRLRVEVADGRVFLKRSTHRFDLIFVDAFGANRYGLTIPPHLVSREFFEEAKQRLAPEGIMVFNSPQNLGAAITNAVYKTLANVFPEVYVFNTPYMSCMLMAVVTPRRLTRDGLVARGKEAEARGTISHVVDRLEHLSTSPPPESIAEPLLTDDYAPTELLLRNKWIAPAK